MQLHQVTFSVSVCRSFFCYFFFSLISCRNPGKPHIFTYLNIMENVCNANFNTHTHEKRGKINSCICYIENKSRKWEEHHTESILLSWQLRRNVEKWQKKESHFIWILCTRHMHIWSIGFSVLRFVLQRRIELAREWNKVRKRKSVARTKERAQKCAKTITVIIISRRTVMDFKSILVVNRPYRCVTGITG